MKKLILSACVAIALVGCEKKEAGLTPTSPQNISIKEQVASVIQKADADLYRKIYLSGQNEKAPKPSVKYCPGVFVILDHDVASGTCFPNQNVCFIIIGPAKSGTGGVQPPETTPITSDLNEVYGNDALAELIINSSPVPQVKQVSALNVSFDNNGVATFNYK